MALTIFVIAVLLVRRDGRVVRGQTIELPGAGVSPRRSGRWAPSPLRIMVIDVLPNLVAPVTVLASLLTRPRSSSRPRSTSWGSASIPVRQLGRHPGRLDRLLPGGARPAGLPGRAAAAHHARVQPPRGRHPRRARPQEVTCVALSHPADRLRDRRAVAGGDDRVPAVLRRSRRRRRPAAGRAPEAPIEVVEQIKDTLGLDRPLFAQYLQDSWATCCGVTSGPRSSARLPSPR